MLLFSFALQRPRNHGDRSVPGLSRVARGRSRGIRAEITEHPISGSSDLLFYTQCSC